MNADWCPECDAPAAVVDEFDEQVGFEERARPVRVIALDCGDEIVTKRRAVEEWAAMRLHGSGAEVAR